jgi:hypothetical protein
MDTTTCGVCALAGATGGTIVGLGVGRSGSAARTRPAAPRRAHVAQPSSQAGEAPAKLGAEVVEVVVGVGSRPKVGAVVGDGAHREVTRCPPHQAEQCRQLRLLRRREAGEA